MTYSMPSKGEKMSKETELHRMAFLAGGCLNTLELVFSRLHNGFLEDDFTEFEKTFARLHKEILCLDAETRHL